MHVFKKILRGTILFNLAALFAIALSCDHQQYSGTISLRGNDPFHKLILTTDDGRYFELVGEGAKKLFSYQYSKVVIVGKVKSPSKGPGFPAQIEVTEIISISK